MEKKLKIRIVFREKRLFFKFTFYFKCFYYFRTSLIFLIDFIFWISLSYSSIEQKGSMWVAGGLLNDLQEHFSQSPLVYSSHLTGFN